jgi:GGDEF domain-containing protein
LEKPGLGTYTLISKWGFPKTYRGKIMLVAFLGTHAPLLGAALYLLLGSSVGLGAALRILAILVAVTLVGTAATLLALGALLAPVRLTSSALKRYLDDRTKPELPMGFSDEVGRLMADVRYAVEHLDSSIRSLEGLSGTDHLTGLPNRREGEARMTADMSRARRGGGQFTLAVVDLDGFKTINDTHGHHAGDICIRHVADVIGRSVRATGWPAGAGTSSCWRCGRTLCSPRPKPCWGGSTRISGGVRCACPGERSWCWASAWGHTGTRARTTFGSC